jgi:hypothetical protein
MVVPAPELLKRRRRRYVADKDAKGIPQEALGVNQLGTSRITGPLGAAGAGCAGPGWALAGLAGGLPNCPIGPYAIATTNTIEAMIAPKMPATDWELIPADPLSSDELISWKIGSEE